MHDAQRCLFDYANMLPATDITAIEIRDGKVVMTTCGGIRLLVDRDDKRIIPLEILNFDAFERDELRVMTKIIKDGTTMLDIGANIGWYSLNFAKIFPSLNVLAFEPVPKTFQYLQDNLKINDTVGVQVYNFGFSDERKDIDMYYYPAGMGNACFGKFD